MNKDYLRIEDVLLSYWKELSKENNGNVPNEEQIKYERIADVWDDCFLALITSNHGYRYEYLGKNLIEAYGENVAELGVDNIISPTSHETVAKFDDVIKKKIHLSDEGEFTNSNNFLIKYRQILLPFVNNSEEVTYIMGGMRWKLY